MERYNIFASFPIIWVLDFIRTMLIPAVSTEDGDNEVNLSRGAIDKTLQSMRVSCVCVCVGGKNKHIKVNYSTVFVIKSKMFSQLCKHEGRYIFRNNKSSYFNVRTDYFGCFIFMLKRLLYEYCFKINNGA